MDVSSIINKQFKLQYARTNQLQLVDGTSGTSAVKQKTTTKDWVLRTFYPGAKSGKSSAGKSSASVHPITNGIASVALAATDKVAEKAPPSPKDDSILCREPSVSFRQVPIDSAAEKFKFSLVGKFYRSRPSLEQIRKWVLARLRLSGEWSVTLLDRNHVLIKMDNEDDMLKIWAKSRWFVRGYKMKVFKWTPDFRPSDGEPSISPVWISFPSLPVVYFEQDLLYAIASLLGRVLSMDVPTRRLLRTNVARVCVEVDLLKEHPHRVWIGVEKGGFWQAVKYEKLPSYCTHCRQQGHSLEICKAKRTTGIPKKEPLNFVEKAKSMTQQLSAAFQTPHLAIKEEKLDGAILEKHYQTCPSLLEKHSRSNLRISSFTGKLQIKAGKGNRDCEEPNYSYPVQGMQFFSASVSKKINDNVLTASSFSNENVSRTKTVEILDEGKSLMQEEIKEVEEEDESDDDQQKLGAEDGEVKDAEELVDNEDEKREKQETVNSNVTGGCHQERRQTIPYFPELSPQVFHQDNRKKKTLFFWKTKAKQTKDEKMIPNIRVKNFTLRELRLATDGFSHKNLVGMGGYSEVYKGRLVNGSIVVVKRMRQEKTHGNGTYESRFQFKMEVEFSGFAVHKNILPLLGFCSVSTERLLVYPYMANGDVARRLRDGELNLPPLDWSTRKKIALGSAAGLSYLHEQINPKIIHRDIKAANILLNEAYEPLICDFGLVKATDIDDCIVTTIVGTFGHMAPEYYRSGKLSTKTDVFGYGIALLELVTRQRTFDENGVSLRDLVKRSIKENCLENIVDRHINKSYDFAEIEMFINIALLCTRRSPADRPKMSEVVSMLEGKTYVSHDLKSLHIPGHIFNLDDDDDDDNDDVLERSLISASISSEIALPR